jgi:hypothetical protein
MCSMIWSAEYWLLIPGLLVFAIVFLLGAWRLLGRDVLDAKTWRAY